MTKILAGLKPELVWEFFEEITRHPHPSKNEGKLAEYISNWAKDYNFEVSRDSIGNLLVRKPATAGMENRKPICLQGHIDMVCEKNSDVEFDFDNQPLNIYIDGDWVKAKGTTLGADNGIGVAMGMALMASNDIPHPPLELLCTLDEETGLTGAQQLDRGWLKSEILINLDSEEDGAFTIGCAGGMNTSGSYKYKAEAVPAGSASYEIAIKGLRGGHSGIEIHDGRGNAIKLMTRLLWELSKNYGIRLSSIRSGNKHNAIPREGFALITVESAKENEVLKFIEEYNKTVTSEYETKEPNLNISATPVNNPDRIMTADFQKKLLNSFYAMPHGVIRMSPDIPGLVQTSTNFAIVETRETEVYVLTSQRSSAESEKFDVGNMVWNVLELGGADVTAGDGYPGWQPNMKSPILNTAVEIFKVMYGKEPKIEAIHAGLECGLVGEKYPGMDMLSFGPNLKDVHSPDEKVQISTVEKCWNLLQNIVKNIPQKAV